MTINENTPILVAPRPVRIASEPGSRYATMRSSTPLQLVSALADHLERVKISGELEIDEQRANAFIESTSPDRDLASPRSSPRSSLPSEALEEFLSILKPSTFFPPTSPILRARRNGASLPNFPYHYKARVLHSRGDSITLVEEMERTRSNAPTRSPEFMIERDDSPGDHERYDLETLRWFSTSTLSSPVNRGHTRNPFQRHPSHEPNSLMPSPRSPSAVPLPSPTPDEMLEMSR